MASSIPLIEGIKPLAVTEKNYGAIQKQEFKKLRDKIQNKQLLCTALENRRVVGTISKHIKQSKGRKRLEGEIIRRISLMPFIISVIQKGVCVERRENEKHGGFYYEVSAKTIEGGREKIISVILTEKEPNGLLYLSVMEVEKVVKKSLTQRDGHFSYNSVRRFPFTPWGQGFLLPGHNPIIPEISEMSIMEKLTCEKLTLV